MPATRPNSTQRNASMYRRASVAVAALALDSLSFVRAAYSVRKLRSAYLGKCLRVRNTTTNVQTDIGFDASGNISEVELSGAGANTTVIRWYDQSGNAFDLVNDATGVAGVTIAAALNGRRTILSTGTKAGDSYNPLYAEQLNTFAVSPSTSARVHSVFSQATNAGGGAWSIGASGVGNYHTFTDGSGYDAFCLTNGRVQHPNLATSTGLRNLTAICNATNTNSAKIYINNIQKSDASIASGEFNASTGSTGTGSRQVPDPAYGDINTSELVFFSDASLDAERATFTSNQQTYFNIV